MSNAPDNWLRLLASWSDELLSTTSRVQHLIGGRHRPTTGSYREALFRRLLRRVLPDRFRVSTGFIYRWEHEPSRQLDVLVWDAQEQSAILEEGELAILTPESVAAIIEVKSVLTPGALRYSLDLLSPAWLVHWCHTEERSRTGLRQQVPHVPLRAVFAYAARDCNANRLSSSMFNELSEFYRRKFGDDAKAALSHQGGPRLRWLNMIDAICIADCLELEQTNLIVRGADRHLYDGPGFVAFPAASPAGNLAVGKFCMYLLWYLRSWSSDDAAEVTFNAAWPTATPGACCFAALDAEPLGVSVWGTEVPSDRLWQPNPPLWIEGDNG